MQGAGCRTSANASLLATRILYGAFAAMKPARNLLVDALRLLFAFGVAAIHLAPNTPAAEKVGLSFLLFAVPFYLTVGLYFFIGKIAGGPGVPRWRELHFERLWLPYTAWTILYVGLHVGKDLAVHRPTSLPLLGTAFYGGAAVQLYFLPLLWLFEVWAWSAILLCRAPERRLLAAMLLGGSAVFAVGGMACRALGFEQVFLSGALYLVGAFLLWVMRGSEVFRRISALVGLILAAALLGLVIGGDPHGLLRFGRGPLAGYAAASLALGFPVDVPVGRWLGFLLGCSYGIYLAHFVFVEAFEFLAGREGWPIKPYDVPEKLSVALVVCVACVALIALARTSRLARAWLLGERT